MIAHRLYLARLPVSPVSPMRLPLLLAALLLSGCAATQPVDPASPAEVERVAARVVGERAVVRTVDGQTLRGRIAALRADSVVVAAQPPAGPTSVATGRVASVEARVFGRPVVTRVGFTLGAAAGFGLFAFITTVSGNDYTPALVGASLGVALAGGAVGVYAYPHPSDERAPGRFVFE